MRDIGTFDHCLLLRVGVIARGNRCVTLMRRFGAIKATRLCLTIAGLAPVNTTVACLKFAGELGIPVYEDYRELVESEGLDLIFELTGDPSIMANLIKSKPASVGILDPQASNLFFDIAQQYEKVAERESQISLTTSFASALLEASPDGVMILDRDYKIINCNNSPNITQGRKREDVVGKHCFDVIHGLLAPCTGTDRICPTKETLRTRRPARAVHEVAGPDGEPRVLQVIAFPLFNILGDIVQFVEIVRDITSDVSEHVEQRARAIKDDLARAAQEDRLTSLGRLVASVCHEINNPISSIVTFNKLILSHLQENSLPPEGVKGFERYLELSVKEALRCGDIVKTLLTFARQKKIEAGRIDLKEMLNTIIMLVSHQLQMAEVSVALEMPQGPFTAWGDHALMQQCLMNLIFNAMESMPGGGAITIQGKMEKTPDKIRLSITDTGQGIAQEDLTRIFEPFYSTKHAGKGVGLGLSMVYGIIREHNGTIEVDSHPGRGTTFTMTLPTSSAKPTISQEDV